jgi:RNA polymerase sigma-70 factor (ECF subfamily)
VTTAPSFKQQLVEAIPMLRGFARSLSGNHDRADDLVQETLAKAIANREKYKMGTNLHAWLVTILRNQYYSEGRRRWREVSDAEGTHAARLVEQPAHAARLEMLEFLAALQVLPDDQREALVLIGASGLSYEEAAEVLGTRVGTVKSRVSRARARLEGMLAGREGFDRGDEEGMARSAARLRQALSI